MRNGAWIRTARITRLLWRTGALAVACMLAPTHTPAAAGGTPLACDRVCLYGALDAYLAALRAKDPGRAPWAARVKNTENNVELRVGDGLWGTITGFGDYEMRVADPQTGEVAVFGVVEETTTKAPYATRLKVVSRTITEV